MKTDVTLESIRSCESRDELAELTHTLQAELNAARDWIADAKRNVSEGGDYAPRDVFRAKEKELRDLGALMNAANERRGALRRLAQAASPVRGPTAARPVAPELLDKALKLLYELYNESYDDLFVALLHEPECERDELCVCSMANDFDLLMLAGGWSARATEPARDAQVDGA